MSSQKSNMYSYGIKIVNHRHYVCSSPYKSGKPSKLLPKAAQRFWERRIQDNCSWGFVAFDSVDGTLLGFLRTARTRRGFQALGTWVDSKARGRGVAKSLWRAAVSYYNPKSIDVLTASRGGSKLVKAMKKEFRDVKWEHIDASRWNG